MANQIIKGNALMLFKNDEHSSSFAYATNHTLTLTTNLSEIASKDHGLWNSADVAGYTWEITAENLFSMEDYFDLFDSWKSGEKFIVKFGLKGESYDTCIGATPEYWTLKTNSDYLSGKVMISNLTVNANNGDTATYNITLRGVGELTHGNSTVNPTPGSGSGSGN